MIPAISIGQLGSTLATDGETITGSFIGFLCVSATTIAAFKGQLVADDGVAITDLSSYTFPAGIYIPVPFSSLTVTTGTIIAVRGAQ